MKGKNFYFISIGVFVLAAAFIVFRHQAKEKNRETRVYYILERRSAASAEEWRGTRAEAARLLNKIEADPGDKASLLALASLYIREARVTGNYMYYDQAAMKCVSEVLKKDENNFEALSLKALIFLSQHHFAEALATGQQAVRINPYNAFVYGTLVDAYVEIGDYETAVDNLEKMIAIRPDIRSYARVSYLREIHGDYAGAIEAMKLAVDAGVAGEETTAWTRVQLAKLYEKTGEIKMAEMHYLITLNERPGYAYALAGLGRVATTRRQYDDAIDLYKQADSSIQDYSLKEELSEVYLLKNQPEKAESIALTIVRDMNEVVAKEMEEDSVGHYSDRELAHAWLKVKNYDKALEHALAEFNRRPENIEVNETLAWVYYLRNEFSKALPHIKVALKTNSKDPALLCRAGLIFNKIGDVTMAKSLLRQVFAVDINLSHNLKSEGLKTLQAL